MTTNRLFDGRVRCWSLMTTMTIYDYLGLVEGAYANRGGLKHQRDALKTTSGRRIRSRMIDDIAAGAVLPPLVLGIIVDENGFRDIEGQTPEQMEQSLLNSWRNSVSIIDGMQRTTALLEGQTRCWQTESESRVLDLKQNGQLDLPDASAQHWTGAVESEATTSGCVCPSD